MSPQLFKEALENGLENQAPLQGKVKARILMAEDLPREALILNDELRTRGYEVDIAMDGVEAIQKVQAYAGYDAILMNFLMPRVNGFMATEFIRCVLKYKGPIIGFSIAHTSDHENASVRAGMNAYIFSGIGGNRDIIKAMEASLEKSRRPKKTPWYRRLPFLQKKKSSSD